MGLFNNFLNKFITADILSESEEELKESEKEQESNKEFTEKHNKAIRKDILKDIDACFRLLEYIKKANTLRDLENDCETIDSLLISINKKLKDVSKDSDKSDEILNRLTEKLTNLKELSQVQSIDNVSYLLDKLKAKDVLYKFFSMHEYLQNFKLSNNEDINLINDFNILYSDFIKLIRNIIENTFKKDSLTDEKLSDELANYTTILNTQIIDKLSDSKSFHDYEESFRNNQDLYSYLSNLFKSVKNNENKFQVNFNIITEMYAVLFELKNTILNLFKSDNKEDTNDDIEITKEFYNNLLDTISSKEFFKKYKLTEDMSGDNQSVRQFLLETIYNNFGLGNMSKYCDKNINSILKNLSNYLSQFKLRSELPEDYESKVKNIINFGILSIALSGTDRFINSKEVFDLLQTLDYYTKNLATKADIRDKVQKPLASLYNGIIKLINPAIICSSELKTIPNREIDLINNGSIDFIFNTGEALDFLNKVNNSIIQQINILNEIPVLDKQDTVVVDKYDAKYSDEESNINNQPKIELKDEIIEDSEIIDVKTTVIKLYEWYYKEFYNNYKNVFDEYNKYIGNL